MDTSTRDKILDFVTKHYFESPDFNGPLATVVMTEFDLEWSDVQEILAELLNDDKICLMFASVVQNPHIKRLPELPIDLQLTRLQAEEPETMCVYPSVSVLEASVTESDYVGQPFALRLALGEAQLQPVFFELAVLEMYYSDPRYLFTFSDYGGNISISSEFEEDPGTHERDKILVQSFGLGYDDDGSRVVTVFLRYLAGLSSEHQQMWNARLVNKHCQMADAYYRSVFLSGWTADRSFYEAILKEQSIINELSELMGRPRLFRATFDMSDRPKEFSLFLRPTKTNFLNFVHTFDNMLSDNINKKFVRDDVALERNEPLKDGRVERQRLGSLQVLENWIREKVNENDLALLNEVIGPLKEIRELRNKGKAHLIVGDEYDPTYFDRQQDLLERVHGALRSLRRILVVDPSAKDYELPEWVDGQITHF